MRRKPGAVDRDYYHWRMTMARECRYLIALAVTCLSETAVGLTLAHWAKRFFRLDDRGASFLSWLFPIASLTTLPFVWFVFPRLFRQRLSYVAASEAFAVLAEAAIYTALGSVPVKRSLLLSFILNAISFGLGLIVQPLLYG